MMKSISLFVCLLFITTIVRSQEFNVLNTSPGENTNKFEKNWEPLELEDEIDWRESSIGLFFMPIPLSIDELIITDTTGQEIGDRGNDFFSVGFGLSFNYDFKKSGDGLGLIAYGAYISGSGDLDGAIDIFGALKYDIKLGALSKFELSPLAGIGNLSVSGKDVDGDISGSSLYFSGGVRITYLVMNNLFVGADIQTVPVVFDTQKLFDVPDTIAIGDENDEVEIVTVDTVKAKFAIPFQVNLSVRYNIF